MGSAERWKGRWPVMLFLVAALLAMAGSARAADEPAGRFLIATDLHFDPLADPALFARLRAADPVDWRKILETAPQPATLGHSERDPGWPLVSAAILAMKQRMPEPAFILLPGDFLAHRLRERFLALLPPIMDPAAGPIGRPDPVPADQAYRDFTRKTMAFLALAFEQSFPQTSLFPALGNNDDSCGDYVQQPNGPFLQDMLPILHGMLGLDGRSGEVGTSFDEDWQAVGSYDLPVPQAPRLRLLVIDSTFFSRRYRNPCGSRADIDGGARILSWLGEHLDRAARAGDKVWIMTHIPPGLDVYASLHAPAAAAHPAACPAPVPMWNPAYEAPFAALVAKYRATIAGGFTGHTHMDDFRLLDAPGPDRGSSAFFLITPAISPIFGQNPAFREGTYDAGGGVLDTSIVALTNLGAPAAPDWRPGDPFTKAWGLPRLDVASLIEITRRTGAEGADRARWLRRFGTGRADYWTIEAGRDALGPAPQPRTIAGYRCGEITSDPAAWVRCTCRPEGANPP